MTEFELLQSRLKRSSDLQRMLRSSALVSMEGIPLKVRSFEEDVVPLPRFDSGLISAFNVVHGGYTGLTILAGAGGSGKSSEALACALTNSADPAASVHYLDAENYIGDQIDRARGWFGSDAEFADGMAARSFNFHWYEVLPGMGWQQHMHGIADRLTHENERVLIIVDSVNAFSRMLDGNPLMNASRIYMSLMVLCRVSGGAISVLALSELNKQGELKGLEGVFISSMALKLSREPDIAPNVIRLEMLKNRSGRFQSDLGLYEIDAKRCRLVSYEPEGSYEPSNIYPLPH